LWFDPLQLPVVSHQRSESGKSTKHSGLDTQLQASTAQEESSRELLTFGAHTYLGIFAGRLPT
jgi:hypothetical protein